MPLHRIALRLDRLDRTPFCMEQTFPRASLRPGLVFGVGGHWVTAKPRQDGGSCRGWDQASV